MPQTKPVTLAAQCEHKESDHAEAGDDDADFLPARRAHLILTSKVTANSRDLSARIFWATAVLDTNHPGG